MGDGEKASLRLQFNPKVRLAFHGATITTDAGLLAFREFDDALGLTEIAEDYLQESRTGRNILHHLVPLLRQSIYSRLAGYDDTNDAVRLSQDPAMRVIVGWQGSERKGASTSEMGRFETEFLTQEDNRQALARMNTRWVERAMAHTLHQRVILDMDSSELEDNIAKGQGRQIVFESAFPTGACTPKWRRRCIPGTKWIHIDQGSYYSCVVEPTPWVAEGKLCILKQDVVWGAPQSGCCVLWAPGAPGHRPRPRSQGAAFGC